MANPEPRDTYGPEGSVPNISPSTEGPGQRIRAEASPGDFGAQVGQAKEGYGEAVTGAGSAVNEVVDKYHRMAVEAKANEAIVNQWAPAASELRQQYDTLRGQDKIAGYDNYIKTLQGGANKFVEDASGPYEKEIRSQWVTRHIANEIDGAKREQVQAIQQFEDSAHADKLLLHQNEMVNNYQDPNVVQQNQQMIDAQILKHGIDQGADPNDLVHAVMIQQQQKQARGEAAIGMVGKAIQDGNVDAATRLYDGNRQDIPGHEQIAIDETLRVAAVKQTSENNSAAILTGLPLPNGVGRPPIQTQMAVVRAADAAGVDGNQALTIARIESSYGQNVGKRGDIGQTGKPGNIEEQSANMAIAIKDAASKTETALGRKPDAWETYVTYQQGAGAGPALFKASTENPNMRAVDVLKPLYKNPVDAINAITNNGGNVTMTSGQFLDFIKQKYSKNEDAARCEIPGSIAKTFSADQPELTTPQVQTSSLADAMAAQHQTYGPALQKGSNPKEDLVNFDKIYAPALAQANLITNVDEREGTIRALNKRREVYSTAAAAYGTVLNDQLEKTLKDPKFTDAGQLPPELASQLTDKQLNYVDRVAEQHLAGATGIATKDMKEYGPGMFDLMRDINSGVIKNPQQLLDHLPDPKNGKSGDITLAGYKQLITQFSHDPDSKSDQEMQTQAFKVIKRQLSGEDDMLGIKDPKGEELFSRALPKLFKAIQDGKSQTPPLTMGEMTDPGNKAWIGNIVQGLKRSAVQQNMDMMHSAGAVTAEPATSSKAAPSRGAIDIIREYQNTTDPAKRDALKKEAVQLGLIPEEVEKPEAPISR